MEKKLTRVKTNVYFYENGKKIEGFPPRVSGDLSGVRGDLTGVWGSLSDCAITDEERAAGVDINDLVDSAEPNAQALREAGDATNIAVFERGWREG